MFDFDRDERAQFTRDLDALASVGRGHPERDGPRGGRSTVSLRGPDTAHLPRRGRPSSFRGVCARRASTKPSPKHFGVREGRDEHAGRGPPRDWLGLVDPVGPFLTLPVLRRAWPDGLDRTPTARCVELRELVDDLGRDEAPPSVRGVDPASSPLLRPRHSRRPGHPRNPCGDALRARRHPPTGSRGHGPGDQPAAPARVNAGPQAPISALTFPTSDGRPAPSTAWPHTAGSPGCSSVS